MDVDNGEDCNRKEFIMDQFTITKKESDEVIAQIFKDDRGNWKAIVDDRYEVKELAKAS